MVRQVVVLVVVGLVRRPSWGCLVVGWGCWGCWVVGWVGFLGVRWFGWSSVVTSDVLKDKIMCSDSSFIAGDI